MAAPRPVCAERARASNDAQIIAFGAQIIAPVLAKKLLDVWLASEFQGGRSLGKVQKVQRMEDTGAASDWCRGEPA